MDALVGRGLSGRPFRRSIERLTIQYNVYSGVLLVRCTCYCTLYLWSTRPFWAAAWFRSSLRERI